MVKIFQSDRPFSTGESLEIQKKLNEFTANWSSHGNSLAATGVILHDRFIILTVDERLHGASGCSIDKAMRFIQEIGSEFEVDFFNRYLFSFQKNGLVHTVDKDTFSRLYADGTISDETMVFDTLINSQSQLENQFIRPLGTSWHKRMVV